MRIKEITLIQEKQLNKIHVYYVHAMTDWQMEVRRRKQKGRRK
jgi:hypothetical protein